MKTTSGRLLGNPRIRGSPNWRRNKSFGGGTKSFGGVTKVSAAEKKVAYHFTILRFRIMRMLDTILFICIKLTKVDLYAS